MQQVLDTQRDFFCSGRTKDLDSRKKVLIKLKNILKLNEQALYEAIYQDFKKSEFDTYSSELALIYHDIEDAISNLKRWAKPQKIKTNWANMPAKSRIYKDPLGCSLIIGAWNYPYQLSLCPAIAAIAAGCTVVIKPSELPKNTSAFMAKLINNNFDPGFLYVAEGGIPETTELLNLKWDKIFFTGSVPVGKIVYAAAAKNLTPVTLELGGKSPAIISQHCKLDITAKRLSWAKFLNAGQTCIAPDYVIVHSSIADKLVAAIQSEIEKSSYHTDNQNYVQIIDQKNFDRVSRLIDNNKLALGGICDVQNRTISPTLLYPASWEDKSMQDEIFGPILPILVYDKLDDALKRIKTLTHPLSAYIFTEKSSEKRSFLKQLSFGGGSINDAVMHIANSNLPFGGVGNSGIGSYHGKAGFDAFSHSKSILHKGTLFEPNLKYSPISNTKLIWIKRLLKLG